MEITGRDMGPILREVSFGEKSSISDCLEFGVHSFSLVVVLYHFSTMSSVILSLRLTNDIILFNSGYPDPVAAFAWFLETLPKTSSWICYAESVFWTVTLSQFLELLPGTSSRIVLRGADSRNKILESSPGISFWNRYPKPVRGMVTRNLFLERLRGISS